MNSKVFLTLVMFFLFANFSNGQRRKTFCSTKSIQPKNTTSPNRHNLNLDPLCFRIYIQVVRRSDGTGGQTLENIN